MSLARLSIALLTFVALAPALRAAEPVVTYYGEEEEDRPYAPYSDAAQALKNVPIGAGFDLSVGGQWDMRAQSFDNRRDFTYGKNDADQAVLSRLRLSLDIRHGDLFRLFVMGQDAHEFWSDDLPGPNLDENSADLYQAYVEFGLVKDIADLPVVRIRLGRQEWKSGAEYLFGDRDWFNRGQVFDMGLVAWRPEGFELEFIGGRPVAFDNNNLDEQSPKSFGGVTLKAVGIPGGHTVEGYTFVKWDNENSIVGEGGTHGPERAVVFGMHATGTFGRFDYSTEWTGNAGERAGNPMQGWRADAHLGYTIPLGWRTLRIGGAYTLASGERDPNDGRIDQFETLWPDPFLFHGKLLVAGGINIEDITGSFRARVWRGGQIDLDWHHLRAQTPKGPVIDVASFAPLRRDPTGNAGREVGDEMNLHITHKFHENLSIGGGVFIFFPGRFMRETGGGRADPARNIFFTTRISF